LFFKNIYSVLTILNLKNLFANLQTFWGEFFHCVFNLVKVIKSEERAVFWFGKRQEI
jgi:hypothetical protein